MKKFRRGKLYLLDGKKTWELKDDLPNISKCEDEYYARLRWKETVVVKVEDCVDVQNETSTAKIIPDPNVEYHKINDCEQKHQQQRQQQ